MKFLALLTLFSLSGCGKFLDQFSRLPGGFTRVAFNHGSQTARNLEIGLFGPGSVRTNSVLGGGAIVYAAKSDGKVFSGTLQDENGTLTLTLPNGDYSFSAVGWPNANFSDTSSGYVRCGTAPAATLTGQPQDVTFSLKDTNACYSSPDFALSNFKSSSPATIGTLSLNFCHQSTDLTTLGAASYCSGLQTTSAFYAGNASTAKIEHVEYFPASDTFLFTASHDSYQTSNAVPPNQPYELFRLERSSGKQTKIPLNVTGYGVSEIARPAGHNKLLFLMRDSSGLGTLWSYNLADGVVAQVSKSPTSGTGTGVKEFRISDDGTWVVYVGDLDTLNMNELYSNSIPADTVGTFSPSNKISGAISGVGVGHCTSCGGEQYYFDISRGAANPYVVYSAQNATTTPLYIATMDGTPVPTATIGAGGGSNVPSGIVVSGTEISSGTDFTDQFDFSPDSHYVIYHAHSGSFEKAMVVNVNYVPGTSLTTSTPTQITQGITYPFFLTGESTSKAVVFLGSSVNGPNSLVTTAVVDLSTPANFYKLFDESGTGLNIAEIELTQNDSVLVAAFEDNASSRVFDLRSVSTVSSADYTTPSFSYTGGQLTSPSKLTPVSGNNNGDYFRISPSTTFGLLFIADKVVPGETRLWTAALASAPVDSSGTGIVGPTPGPAVPVAGATYDANGNAYFSAAIDIAGTNELYLAHPGAQPTRMGSTSYIGSISHLSDASKTPISQILPLNAAPTTDPGLSTPFVYHLATGVYESIGHIGALGAVSGIGRVRISMLQSNDGINSATAFDSGCLSFTSSAAETQHLSTSVRVPSGTTSLSPFATEIDVYPLAKDCNGPPQRHIFPNGIAAALDQVNSDVLIRASGTGMAQVFVRDQ